MLAAFQFAVRVAGIPIEDASRMASLNPAKVIGIDGSTGSIKPGKKADLIWLDRDLNLKQVWVAGNKRFVQSNDP